MTTIAAGRLSDTLQTLVDARLDTIDRMLLGRVNRHDRLAIVREVETQIFDLIQGRDADNLDRDDILAVLARLDPPEAYLPDEATGEAGPIRFATPSQPRQSLPRPRARMPKASGIVGIVSIFLVSFAGVLFLADGNTPITGVASVFLELLFFGSIFGSFILGLLSIIMAASSRLASGWAIVGLVTGILSMFCTVIGTFAIFAG